MADTWSRTLSLAVRFSLREMRGGLSGFLIFLACIALGVAAIGGVNSVAQSITAGVANQGQTLLLDQTPMIIGYFYNYLTATAQGVTGVYPTAIGHLFLYNAAKS